MLEWIPTKRGDVVPQWNGVLLASKIDPEREAKAWLTRHERLLKRVKSVFVLGLAGGHHIKELIAYGGFEKIIVLEAHLEFQKSVASLAFPPCVKVFCGQPLSELVKDTDFTSALGMTCVTLPYSAALRTSPEYYREVQKLLVGRDWESFNFHLQCRPELADYFDKIDLSRLPLQEITIKEINKCITKTKGAIGREAMLWALLGELVK